MLQSPKSGDNILAWAKNATKEINSNTIHNGIGIKVLRTPQGTNISVQPGGKGGGTAGVASQMPFDVSFDHYDPSSQRVYLKVKHGDLYYNLGPSTTQVAALADMPEEIVSFELDVENEINLILGLQFNYNDSTEGDGTYAPENWTFTALPSIGDESYTDLRGIKYYPIFCLKSNNDPEDEEEDEGGSGGFFTDAEYPVKFSFDVVTSNRTNHILGIQLYHGDIWVSYSDGACFIGEVSSETQIGEFSANILDFGASTGGQTNVRVNALEMAYTDALPAGARVIVHPVYIVAYDSDDSTT